MKIIPNYSPNYTKKTRSKKNVKFVIIHYTGMQSEIESIERLKNPKYNVSCHYLINRKGRVFQLVKDLNIAWHAGKSKWKKFKNLNSKSIGIELVNKGHELGYQNYSLKQIQCLIWLCKNLKKKYKIKSENFLGHSDIAPLRKKDPGEKFPWKKLSKFNIGKWYSEDQSKIEFNRKKVRNLFFKNLRKLGYKFFSINKASHYDKRVIRSFQQHFLPNNVTGKIDKKTFEISHFLINQFKIS
tara:strand:- start:114 stop:836 length:723 start_codon:yes stop_codon:yes gene_type:complete